MILLSWILRRLHWDHNYYRFTKKFHTIDDTIEIGLCRIEYCDIWNIKTSPEDNSWRNNNSVNDYCVVKDEEVPKTVMKYRSLLRYEKMEYFKGVNKRKNWREMKYPKLNKKKKKYCIACGEDQSNNGWEIDGTIKS